MKKFKDFKLNEKDLFDEENWDEAENNEKVYISNQLGTCPVCNGGLNPEGPLEIDPDPNFVYYNWVCFDCGFSGMETYELVFRSQTDETGTDINVGDVVNKLSYQ